MKTVYVLGAGFSAPLGIPVVSNFLERATDLFFREPARYAHFEQVFQQRAALALAQSYFETDLFNIEEILSLLEMRAALVGDNRDADQFRRFIGDVVQAYTPPLTELYGEIPAARMLSSDWEGYSRFVAMILGHVTRRFHVERQNQFRPEREACLPNEYAVISLNYDLVPEMVAQALCSRDQQLPGLEVANDPASEYSGFRRSLVKLHGCLQYGDIVPPTWNKHLNNDGIKRAWTKAHWLLSQANFIRVLGYSLPEGDNYFKYLLRSAIADNKHLKSFDVVCLDPDGSVQKRYEKFVRFPRRRFLSCRIEEYLNGCSQWMNYSVDQIGRPDNNLFAFTHGSVDPFDQLFRR